MSSIDHSDYRAEREEHGMYKTPEYRAWAGMKRRCCPEGSKYHPKYHERGIKVCQEWAQSFMAFYRHIGPRPSRKHSVDRIDNERGYEPGNVRWATRDVQNRNTSVNRMLTFRGETMCVLDWAKRIGTQGPSLNYRINDLGWSVERALTEPILVYGHRTPEKIRMQVNAIAAVAVATRKGILVRPESCPKCGTTERKVQAIHHLGYEREHYLDVIWLCTRCKNERRRELIQTPTLTP